MSYGISTRQPLRPQHLQCAAVSGHIQVLTRSRPRRDHLLPKRASDDRLSAMSCRTSVWTTITKPKKRNETMKRRSAWDWSSPCRHWPPRRVRLGLPSRPFLFRWSRAECNSRHQSGRGCAGRWSAEQTGVLLTSVCSLGVVAPATVLSAWEVAGKKDRRLDGERRRGFRAIVVP